jgi:hypothetical protein
VLQSHSDVEIYKSMHPWKYTFLESFKLSHSEEDEDSQLSSLLAQISLLNDDNGSILSLTFQGVKNLRVQLTRDYIQLRGLEITNISSSQWEGLSYFVHETEENQLSFYCKSFEASVIESEKVE